jgi:omega-6 fatty acid desaturase (delta-12 desaturase)
MANLQTGRPYLVAHAIAMPAASDMSEKERSILAEELGYRNIGAELPEDVSLSNIIQSLPSEVIQP